MPGTTVPKGSDFVVVGLGKSEALIVAALLIAGIFYGLWRIRQGGSYGMAG